MDNFDLKKYLAEGKLLNENENQLVIDGDFIKRKHNPFLPQEFFGDGDQQQMLHMFSKNAILYDITGELLPYLEEFGGYRSSYNGADVIKFPLDNPRITLLNPAQKFLKPGEKYKSFNSFDDLETLDRYSDEGSSLKENAYNAYDGNPEVEKTIHGIVDLTTKLRKLGNEAYGGEKKNVYSSEAGDAFKAFDKALGDLDNALQSVDVRLSK